MSCRWDVSNRCLYAMCLKMLQNDDKWEDWWECETHRRTVQYKSMFLVYEYSQYLCLLMKGALSSPTWKLDAHTLTHSQSRVVLRCVHLHVYANVSLCVRFSHYCLLVNPFTNPSYSSTWGKCVGACPQCAHVVKSRRSMHVSPLCLTPCGPSAISKALQKQRIHFKINENHIRQIINHPFSLLFYKSLTCTFCYCCICVFNK